ncbi:RDD family protein [Prosthecobacter sp.]|uniref:RDD family protein n=1 Tax=Prosthecobacter sp. TaxID=1965333 RepID=UPI003783F7AA
MTIQDALLILDLSAPISREMLGRAYEEGVAVWNPKNFEGRVSLLAKAAAKTEQLFMAHDLLSRLPDDVFPFLGGAKTGGSSGGMAKAGALPMPAPAPAPASAPLPAPSRLAEAERGALPPPQPQPHAMGVESPAMEHAAAAEGEPQARPMPRAMRPRPQQMSAMPPQMEQPLHESPRAEEAVAAPQPSAAVMSSGAEAEREARRALPPLPSSPRMPQEMPPEAMYSEAQHEAPVSETAAEQEVMEEPGLPPVETRQAPPPMPQEAVRGKQPNKNAKALPPLPANSAHAADAANGQDGVQRMAQPGGRPAPVLYRAGAWIIDCMMVGIFMTLVGMVTAMATPSAPGSGMDLVAVVRMGAGTVFAILYYVMMESSATQATLGKKACGLVVTDMEGRRISQGRATGRYFARLLAGPLTLGIGYLMAAFTRQRQGLHDMVSGCLVRRGVAEGASPATVNERTPRVLIYMGVGVVAMAGMVGYTLFLKDAEISLPADTSLAQAPAANQVPVTAPAPLVSPAPAMTAAPGAGGGAVAAPATGATVWKKGLPMADVQALAARGDVQAEIELAFAYAAGTNVTKNLATAAEWMRKAAETGDGFAQYHMGYAYRMGEGVAKDDAEAARWYRKAAEQGVPLAQVDLACAYFTGEGVPKDDAASVVWMRKAAEQNNKEAQDSLGSAYQYGVGVAKDPAEAVQWYRKAAEQNYGMGCYHLAVCYEDGVGVTQDLVEALMWYMLSATTDNPDITASMVALEKRMTTAQQWEAKDKVLKIVKSREKK